VSFLCDAAQRTLIKGDIKLLSLISYVRNTYQSRLEAQAQMITSAIHRNPSVVAAAEVGRPSFAFRDEALSEDSPFPSEGSPFPFAASPAPA
jgi:hypothetical protein